MTSDDIIEIGRVANEIVGHKCAVHRTTLPLKDSKRIPNLVTLVDEVLEINLYRPRHCLMKKLSQDLYILIKNYHQ